MPILLLSVPGLSRKLLDAVPAESALGRLVGSGRLCDFVPDFPAVTCSVQATMTTGQPPSVHGIIANGMATYRSPADAELVDGSNHAEYRRDVSFWEQSNQFLQVPRFWEASGRRTAMLFFQHSMPGFAGTPKPSADLVLTPKPEHGPDGRITSLLWDSLGAAGRDPVVRVDRGGGREGPD
jgi:predicted AlkP superfamily pyrophosphatase or phosphodiesterase